MAAGPKPIRSAKKKRRRTPREEIVDYVVEIDGWDWGYSFSLNSERQPIDPYHEFRHLQVNGRLLTPSGLKTDRAEISLLPSKDLEEDRRKDLKPVALGSLHVTEDTILGNIAPMLQASSGPEKIDEGGVARGTGKDARPPTAWASDRLRIVPLREVEQASPGEGIGPFGDGLPWACRQLCTRMESSFSEAVSLPRPLQFSAGTSD